MEKDIPRLGDSQTPSLRVNYWEIRIQNKNADLKLANKFIDVT